MSASRRLPGLCRVEGRPFPYAAGFFGERVSRQGVGAGARAAADFAEFADATFPFQVFRPAQRGEERRVPIDFRQRLMADVAGRNPLGKTSP